MIATIALTAFAILATALIVYSHIAVTLADDARWRRIQEREQHIEHCDEIGMPRPRR